MSAFDDSILIRALEQSGDGVLITDAAPEADGPRILWVNAAYERISGYTADDLIGRSPRLLQGPRTSRAVLDSLKTALARGEGFHGETVNYKKDGTPYWVEWDIAPVRGDDGRVEYFVSIQRETTRRKEAEQALDRAMTALSASNDRLRDLASVLSHDLLDPIGTARGYADLLRSRHATTLDAAGNRYLEAVLSSLDRMTAKIRDLAEHAARQAVDPMPVDPNDLLAEVVDDLHGALEGAGAQVEIATLPLVTGHRPDLSAVFQNLLSNAVKYRHPARAPRIRVAPAAAEAGTVAITVTDNGRGIRTEDRDRVFDRSQRGDHHPEVDGRGLGLSFVRQALRRIGGDILLESTVGEGSTFTIVLPAPDADAARI